MMVSDTLIIDDAKQRNKMRVMLLTMADKKMVPGAEIQSYRPLGLGLMLSGLSHVYKNKPGFYFEAYFARRPDTHIVRTYGITERPQHLRKFYIGLTFRLWGRIFGARLLTWELVK